MADNEATPTRRGSDAAILVFSEKLDGVERSLIKVNDVLDRLADAVAKLSILEERQIQANHAMERAFKEIEKNSSKCDFHHSAQIAETKVLASRVAALELKTPASDQTNKWATGLATALVGALLMFVAKKVGLL